MRVHKGFFEVIRRAGVDVAPVLSGAGREGDFVLVADDQQFRALVSRYERKREGKRPPPLDPSPLEMARNFAGAMERWAKAGFETVDRETHGQRMAICASCPHWDGKARFGLGKCRAPGCGCSRFKHWLASESCPLGKWPG